MNPELREYFQELGRKGGKAKSKAKARAARKNVAKARKARWEYSDSIVVPESL